MPSGKPLTIRDLAKAARVSVATVSRALNGRPGVSQATRERILALAREWGFVPNAAAREMVGVATAVGILFAPGVRRHTPYFTLLLEALSEALWREGLRVAEVEVDPKGKPRQEALGYILLGAHEGDRRVEALSRQGVPFVLVGVGEGIPWVAPEDVEGGYLATRHLVDLGHRTIAHLTGYPEHQAGRERLLGYRKALAEAGIPFREDLVLDGAFDPLTAYRTVRKAWEQGLRFTALFAASDEMALGAWAALEDLGVRVPEEVSLVGYDDLPEFGERLTTVRQDIPTIARKAVALLLEARDGMPPRGLRVPVRLVVRGTTRRREVGA